MSAVYQFLRSKVCDTRHCDEQIESERATCIYTVPLSYAEIDEAFAWSDGQAKRFIGMLHDAWFVSKEKGSRKVNGKLSYELGWIDSKGIAKYSAECFATYFAADALQRVEAEIAPGRESQAARVRLVREYKREALTEYVASWVEHTQRKRGDSSSRRTKSGPIDLSCQGTQVRPPT